MVSYFRLFVGDFFFTVGCNITRKFSYIFGVNMTFEGNFSEHITFFYLCLTDNEFGPKLT